VGPRAGLDDVERRKFLTLPGFELDPLVVQPVASRYTDCAIPALEILRTVSVTGIYCSSDFATRVRTWRVACLCSVQYRAVQ
jgi:hypothetical protein